jgi:hypothetical protein
VRPLVGRADSGWRKVAEVRSPGDGDGAMHDGVQEGGRVVD